MGSNRDKKRQTQNREARALLPREEETNFCFGRNNTHAHYQQAPVLSPSDKTIRADLEIFQFYPLLYYKKHNSSTTFGCPKFWNLNNTFKSIFFLVSKTIWMFRSLVFQSLFLTPSNNSNISECSISTKYSDWCFCHLWIFCTIFPSLKLVNPELPLSQLMSWIESCM